MLSAAAVVSNLGTAAPIRAIHQVHASSALGDGITTAMVFIQSALRRSGYVSNIYGTDAHANLTNQIEHLSRYEDDSDAVLIVHYSVGSDLDEWIATRRARLVLIYHNITPPRFYAAGSAFAHFSEAGRRQLAQWAANGIFAAAIADSAFNAGELTDLGFAAVATIPLLVDLDRIRAHPGTAVLDHDLKGDRNLLFVGQIADSKNQLGLVRMMAHLVRLHPAPVRLLLAGATTSIEYLSKVHQTISALGLTDHIRVLGPLSDADLRALFRTADLYVSDSPDDGFGMPLVQAMACGLPVLARAAGAVAATLGPGGLVMTDPSPAQFAAAVNILLQERGLRRRIIQGQHEALAALEPPVLIRAFEQALRQADLDVTLVQPPAWDTDARTWLIEGPFDSTYSLALVNRELARGLSRLGESVALVSRDGATAFEPDAAFLAANPDLAQMVKRGRRLHRPMVVLRNQYPPFVAELKGTVCVLANYAWEESGFPAAWVDEFNASLDLVTVTSQFVAKLLRDNGVRVPIAVVGNGADHVVRDEAGRSSAVPDRFRFLHVSSGFPRKGVDVLLAAWRDAFTAADPVELLLKLFPNIHNHVADDVKQFRTAYPDAAPITLIDADIESHAMVTLYQSAAAIVCPTRGEGFGLPLAEAMVLGIPVVTTGYGGQTDFCTPETAWLCDYHFAYANTHLDVPDSVWVEPCVASLSQVLCQVRAATPAERNRRTAAARDLILSRYTWDSVARRTRAAIDAVLHSRHRAEFRKPVIGLITTWNTRCGVAAYAQSMMSAITPDRLRVFANRVPETVQPDAQFVARCWAQDCQDKLNELFAAIAASHIDAVVIQFSPGFFNSQSLQTLLDRLHAAGLPVYIVIHSIIDAVTADLVVSLRHIRDTLARVNRLLVHSVHDLDRLKAIGLIGNVALFPMGAPAAFAGNRSDLRYALGWQDKTVIASFGHLLPHKGLRELIAACALLKAQHPGVHLLMLNALSPADASTNEYRLCQGDIRRLGLQHDVTIMTAFLDEDAVTAYLAAADIVAYPYQESHESTSAAVRAALASLTPVVVTPLPIFADVAKVCHTLPGTSPADIADGLLKLVTAANDPAIRLRQEAWVAAHAWPKLSARLENLIRGELQAAALPS